VTAQQVKDALQDFFSDTNRSPQETQDGLYDIRDEVDNLIENLASDLGE
jgi:hypothetical protein